MRMIETAESKTARRTIPQENTVTTAQRHLYDARQTARYAGKVAEQAQSVAHDDHNRERYVVLFRLKGAIQSAADAAETIAAAKTAEARLDAARSAQRSASEALLAMQALVREGFAPETAQEAGGDAGLR